MIITIDGPAAAGKTTMAKAIAAVKGILYVDTGAFYRVYAKAVTDLKIERSFDPDNTPIRVKAENRNGRQMMSYEYPSVVSPVFVPDHELRTETISQASSRVSANPAVRSQINQAILEFISDNDCILEGRDTGTVIAPDADMKFYLTADPKIRAQRRFLDLCLSGNPTDISAVRTEMAERDERDMTRTTAPLVKPDKATCIDNSDLTAYDCLDIMLAVINERRKYAVL